MTSTADDRPSIHVLAGTNGAGKSSIAGATIRARGADYFNPDEVARRLRETRPGIDPVRANSLAWLQGRRLLEKAIATGVDYTFETTLGGNTIPALLQQASDRGFAVRVWYVGLEGPELHIARVRSRLAGGGHDIPVSAIHERYDRSRQNLIRLLPALAELVILDNSAHGDPRLGERPQPRRVLAMRDGMIRESCPVADVPVWARPVFMAALGAYRS